MDTYHLPRIAPAHSTQETYHHRVFAGKGAQSPAPSSRPVESPPLTMPRFLTGPPCLPGPGISTAHLCPFPGPRSLPDRPGWPALPNPGPGSLTQRRECSQTRKGVSPAEARPEGQSLPARCPGHHPTQRSPLHSVSRNGPSSLRRGHLVAGPSIQRATGARGPWHLSGRLGGHTTGWGHGGRGPPTHFSSLPSSPHTPWRLCLTAGPQQWGHYLWTQPLLIWTSPVHLSTRVVLLESGHPDSFSHCFLDPHPGVPRPVDMALGLSPRTQAVVRRTKDAEGSQGRHERGPTPTCPGRASSRPPKPEPRCSESRDSRHGGHCPARHGSCVPATKATRHQGQDVQLPKEECTGHPSPGRRASVRATVGQDSSGAPPSRLCRPGGGQRKGHMPREGLSHSARTVVSPRPVESPPLTMPRSCLVPLPPGALTRASQPDGYKSPVVQLLTHSHTHPPTHPPTPSSTPTMAASTMSVCSSDLSYGSRVCQPGSWDSCPDCSWQVDDCPESCCQPPCCAPSCCQPSCCAPAPRLTLLCTPVSSVSSPCCQSVCTSSCTPSCCQQSSCQSDCSSCSPCQPSCCVSLCCKPVCCKPVCCVPVCSEASSSCCQQSSCEPSCCSSSPCQQSCCEPSCCSSSPCQPSCCVSLCCKPVCCKPVCCVPVCSGASSSCCQQSSSVLLRARLLQARLLLQTLLLRVPALPPRVQARLLRARLLLLCLLLPAQLLPPGLLRVPALPPHLLPPGLLWCLLGPEVLLLTSHVPRPVSLGCRSCCLMSGPDEGETAARLSGRGTGSPEAVGVPPGHAAPLLS
ncbi:keratin-associated protein 10-3-like [Marmota monax]|uniref:Keratin-associated protein 10-3-like n=1 Tax=Marmota monax TaxID=9995 RepID=A0A834QAB1_MARMO|nr:keratin-associated protein 10-3-like [Marmota monax]